MCVNIMYNGRLYVIIRIKEYIFKYSDMKNIQYFILKDFNIEFYIKFIFATHVIKNPAHFMKNMASFILLIYRLFVRGNFWSIPHKLQHISISSNLTEATFFNVRNSLSYYITYHISYYITIIFYTLLFILHIAF